MGLAVHLVGLGLFALLFHTPVLAADAALENSDARTQLEMRKERQTAEFDAQEQACSNKFAVTDCVNEVNVRRRNAAAALRLEENRLNDAQRRQRERERLQTLQEKAQQRAQTAPSASASDALTTEERLRRQGEKRRGHGPQAMPRAEKPGAVPTQIDAATRQQNAANYAARQQAAEVRRAAREQKLKAQAKAAADLPTPP